MPTVGRGKDVTDEELRATFEQAGEPLKTTEVADRVGLKRRGTLKRLKAHDAIDGKHGVWWLTDWLPGAEPDAASGTYGDVGPTPTAGTTETPATPTPDETADEVVEDAVADVVDDLDFPGSHALVEERRAAVLACCRYLREQEEAAKVDFVDDVYPDFPAGYETSDSWWKRIGQQGLRAVADEVEGVESPLRGQSKWRYRPYRVAGESSA